MLTKLKLFPFIRKIPVKKTAKKCLIGMELTAVSSAVYVSHTVPVEKVVTIGKTAHEHKTVTWETAVDTLSKINKTFIAAKTNLAMAQAQKATLVRIMEEDKNCLLSGNKNKLADEIVKIAAEYNADPIAIACIMKHETHFRNINGTTGKGMMQLTRLPLKDMYERPALYDKKLNSIIKRYPSYTNLFNAVQSQPALNIRVGTILYQHYLEASKGNVKKALRNYNGSYRKDVYASQVYSDIQKYKNLLKKTSI